MKQSAFVAALKFASHAMAVKDIRYYLNGVCLELMGDRMILIGTDGHRMAYVELDDNNSGGALSDKHNHGPQYIIPADTVKVLLSMFKANSTGHMDFEFGDTVTISGAGGILPFKPVEGKFPDWRRVCKSGAKPVPTESIGFNASYLADASKACGALSSTKYSGVKVTLFGPNDSIRVTADAVPVGISEACVVVMPMRL